MLTFHSASVEVLLIKKDLILSAYIVSSIAGEILIDIFE
jgi:hypothetical protein